MLKDFSCKAEWFTPAISALERQLSLSILEKFSVDSEPQAKKSYAMRLSQKNWIFPGITGLVFFIFSIPIFLLDVPLCNFHSYL